MIQTKERLEVTYRGIHSQVGATSRTRLLKENKAKAKSRKVEQKLARVRQLMSSMITDDAKKVEICKKPKTKDILINDHDIDLEFIGTLTTKTHLNVLAELLEISREFFHKESHHTSSAEAL